MPTKANTSYDATVNPVRCCAHIEGYDTNNRLISHDHAYGDANKVFSYQSKYYYFSYDPTQASNMRCCVWNTKYIVDASGNYVLTKGDIRLFCGDKVTL